MQGSWEAYESQVHNVYPYPPQARVYPPPISEPQGYQSYPGEANTPPDHGPHLYRYQDDPDCFTFLRGCLAGLCCCCLLGRCCY